MPEVERAGMIAFMTRGHRMFVGALVVAVAVGHTARARAAEANLVTNPGFEQHLTGWHATHAQIKVASPRTGAYSAQVYGAAAGVNMSIQPTVYPVASTGPEETYTAGAWVLGPRTGARLCMVLNDRDASGALINQTTTCTSAQQHAWQHLHLTYTVRTANHSLTLAVQEWTPQAGDWFDVDDVTLTTLPLPVNVLPPSITGEPRVKNRLVGNPGTWANGPVTLIYQWDRCRFGYGCVAVLQRGSDPTYKVVPADAGYTLAFSVVAVNMNGETVASAPFTLPAYF
jgi:hypothetical protein